MAGPMPAELVRRSAAYLERHGVDSPTANAETLLMHVLGTDRAGLYARREGLDTQSARLFGRALCRRCAGTPLQHLTGEQAFLDRTLTVRPGVFVPRPETEIVVERCLALLAGIEAPHIADVGTGTGAIALALKQERPDAIVVATDSSADALELAQENAAANELEIEFVEGDLLADIAGPLDLVVSNPPYVGAEELDALEPEVREWEPRGALVDEGQTLRLARDAQSVLEGWLVLEVHEEHAQALSGEVMKLGYRAVSIALDLSGRERVLEAQWGTSNA